GTRYKYLEDLQTPIPVHRTDNMAYIIIGSHKTSLGKLSQGGRELSYLVPFLRAYEGRVTALMRTRGKDFRQELQDVVQNVHQTINAIQCPGQQHRRGAGGRRPEAPDFAPPTENAPCARGHWPRPPCCPWPCSPAATGTAARRISE